MSTEPNASPQAGLTRRRFLEVACGAAALELLNLRPVEAALGKAADGEAVIRWPRPVRYRGFEDVYRARWTWDRVVRGTHASNCGCQRCAWNVYVKDGLVWREEQLGRYEQTRPDLPDFNPRGCQKGACYSDRYFHLQPKVMMQPPGCSDRGTRVEVERVGADPGRAVGRKSARRPEAS